MSLRSSRSAYARKSPLKTCSGAPIERRWATSPAGVGGQGHCGFPPARCRARIRTAGPNCCGWNLASGSELRRAAAAGWPGPCARDWPPAGGAGRRCSGGPPEYGAKGTGRRGMGGSHQALRQECLRLGRPTKRHHRWAAGCVGELCSSGCEHQWVQCARLRSRHLVAGPPPLGPRSIRFPRRMAGPQFEIPHCTTQTGVKYAEAHQSRGQPSAK